MPDMTYPTAHRYVCPAGHTYPGSTTPLDTIVPDGANLAPACIICQAPMVSTGAQLTGAWRIDVCCTPAGPNGQWAGPPRDPRKCRYCFGTKRKAKCTICLSTGCNGVHDYCIECDGTKTVTCTDCDGDGFRDPDDPKNSPCPTCQKKGRVRCPACQGSGKPSQEQLAPGTKPDSGTVGTSTGEPSGAAATALAMPAGNINEALQTATTQAQWHESTAAGCERLENDLLVGGLGADDETFSALRSASELATSIARAWHTIESGLKRHAQGVSYARNGFAANTAFLRS